MSGRAAPDDGAALTGGEPEMGIISAGRTAVTAPVAADARPGPWYRRIDWASSFWIVFLFIPLVFLIRTDMPAPLKALGILGLGVFACLYIWAVSTMAIWLELPAQAGVLDQLRPVAGRLALLTGQPGTAGHCRRIRGQRGTPAQSGQPEFCRELVPVGPSFSYSGLL